MQIKCDDTCEGPGTVADTQTNECELLLNAKYTTNHDNKRPERAFQMNNSSPNAEPQLSMTSGKHTGVFLFHWRGYFPSTYFVPSSLFWALRIWRQITKIVHTPEGLTAKDQKAIGHRTSVIWPLQSNAFPSHCCFSCIPSFLHGIFSFSFIKKRF